MPRKPPRYDLPNAAPEPLRLVQRFVNTIDLNHDREWLSDWLGEGGLAAASETDLDRARAVREAIRELLYANNGQGGGEDAAGTLAAAADAALLTIDFPGGQLVARAPGIDGILGRVLVACLGAMHRRQLGAAEVLSQPGLPLGLLRPLEEPLGDLVLDADLRQPDEDADLQVAPLSLTAPPRAAPERAGTTGDRRRRRPRGSRPRRAGPPAGRARGW